MLPSANSPEGETRLRVLASDLPLENVTLKESHRGYDLVLVAGSASDRFTFLVRDPAEIHFEQEGGGEHVGLTVRDASGQCTVVRFQTAASPETLNDISPSEW